MLGWGDVLYGGLLPAAVAAGVLTLVWRATGKAASAWRTALVAGYLSGHWALDARNIGLVSALAKSYQPTEAHHWLPLLMAIAIVPDAIGCFGKRGAIVGWLLRVGLCLFVPWRLFRGSAYLPLMALPDFGFETLEWSNKEATAWIAGLGATLLLSWQSLRAAGEERETLLRSGLATLVAVGAAAATAMSGSLFYGQLLGAFAAALGGAGLASALLKTDRDPEAAAGPLVIIYTSLLVLTTFFAELTTLHAVLLLLAMTTAVGWLPLPQKLPLTARGILRAVICLALLGTAVARAKLDFDATRTVEPNPYSQFRRHSDKRIVGTVRARGVSRLGVQLKPEIC